MKNDAGGAKTAPRDSSPVNLSTVFSADFMKLMIPMFLQSLLTTLVNATDSIMLGQLSQDAMSAIALACQLSQVAMSFITALCVGCTALTAQYYGSNDLDSVRKTTTVTLQFSVGGGLLFFLVSLLLPETVMQIFTNEEALIPLGVSYLRTVSFSFLFMSVSHIFLNVMKNTGDAKTSAAFGSVTVVLNIGLNYLLIFGKLGFPALGAKGAALATSISRGVELLLVCVFVSRHGQLMNRSLRDYLRLYRGILRKFLRYTTPSVLQICLWYIATALLVAIMGHMGSDVVSASSVALIIYNIVSSLVNGAYAPAAGITLGHMLGKGEVYRAKRTGDIILKASVVLGIVMCALTILLGPFAIPVFATLSDQATRYLRIMIVMIGIKCIGKFFNMTLANGIFSSGGDIMYLMKLDIVNMWLVVLPLSAIAAFVLRLNPLVVYAVVNMDEFTKIFHMLARYRTYAWAKNLTTKDWAPPGRYDRQIREKIIDEMPLGVMIISNSGKIVLVNDACADFLGMGKEEIEGGNYKSLFLTEDAGREELSNLFIDAMTDKTQPRETDMLYPCAAGERRLHIRASYMEDEDCRIGLCVMISSAD